MPITAFKLISKQFVENEKNSLLNATRLMFIAHAVKDSEELEKILGKI